MLPSFGESASSSGSKTEISSSWSSTCKDGIRNPEGGDALSPKGGGETLLFWLGISTGWIEVFDSIKLAEARADESLGVGWTKAGIGSLKVWFDFSFICFPLEVRLLLLLVLRVISWGLGDVVGDGCSGSANEYISLTIFLWIFENSFDWKGDIKALFKKDY